MTVDVDLPFSLRPIQVKALNGLRSAFAAGKKRVVLQMPTGSGKTFTAVALILSALEKGNGACFTAPALSLIDQTVTVFIKNGITDVGVIQGNHPMLDYSKPVQIASVQTLNKRVLPKKPKIIIVDECQIKSKAVQKWMEDRPDAFFIGLSATPWRAGMAEEYEELIIAGTMREQIDSGVLCEYDFFAPDVPDLTRVKITAGDYDEKQISEIMSDKTLVGNVVDNWIKHGENRPTLIFAVDRGHAQAIQDEFIAKGLSCGYVDAYTDRTDRNAMLRKLGRGEINAIASVGTMIAGVDEPAISCIIWARPTRSEQIWVQAIGRGIRSMVGKQNCIVFDHAGTVSKLGFPCEIHHDRLKPSRPNAEEKAREERRVQEREQKAPKPCIRCKFLRPGGVLKCPSCGFEHQPPRLENKTTHEEGELKKVKRASNEDKQQFYSELLSMGRSKGWRAHTYRDRFGVWPRNMNETPLPASKETKNFVKHKDIAWRKSQQKQGVQ